jgi:UDP-N-acetylmuramoyl-L-alanyl-D-glutamate--2,6-diaminopimelate ligase
MTFEELLSVITVEETRGDLTPHVRGVTVDSRRVGSGFVFVAIEGKSTDGHRYIEEATKKGAVGIVSERAAPKTSSVAWVRTQGARRAAGLLSTKLAGEPSQHLRLVGVTGTNGKTTTAFLLDGIFQKLTPPSSLMGTVVHRVGSNSRTARYTTPESPEIQTFLKAAVEEGCRFGVLEVSSHGLALGRLEGTEFECAVFTNLSRDHLDFHHDMEDYFAAKRQLFENHLRASGTAVVGLDDSYGRRLAEVIGGSVLTYGFAKDAELRVENVDASFDGLVIRFKDKDVVHEAKSPLVGRHNVLNFLAAYGAARSLGLQSDDILGALEHIGSVPGRFEKIEAGQPFHVVVDYAHTDDALRSILEATRSLPHRRILTVFGCGGDRDRSKRPLMGAVAARLSDLVVLTSDNPRSEDPLTIIREIELGTKGPRCQAEVRVEPDRRKAIRLALSLSEPGDVVLVAGKGHEPYQLIRDRAIPFDDREVVREILTRPMQPLNSH